MSIIIKRYNSCYSIINKNNIENIKSLIYDAENSLAILKSELTDKSYPKKAYVKKIKVE